jgi:hypothetical protein
MEAQKKIGAGSSLDSALLVWINLTAGGDEVGTGSGDGARTSLSA